MRFGWHVRAWVAMGFAALILVMAVAIPVAYISSSQGRAAFVGVMIPGATIIYAVCLYVLIQRPMNRCCDAIVSRRRCGANVGNEVIRSLSPSEPNGLTKEMRKLQSAICIICRNGEVVKRVTDEFASWWQEQPSTTEDRVSTPRGNGASQRVQGTPTSAYHEKDAFVTPSRLYEPTDPVTVPRDSQSATNMATPGRQLLYRTASPVCVEFPSGKEADVHSLHSLDTDDDASSFSD